MPNTIQLQDYHEIFEGWWHRRHSVQFATFNRRNEERNVNVNRNDNDWNDNWWFAGLRNSLISLLLWQGSFVLQAGRSSRPFKGDSDL